MQMKMFLTRLGKSSKMVVTGDLTQVDLPLKGKSGLNEALEVTDAIKGVAQINFDDRDVIRHPIVNAIVKSYKNKKFEIMSDEVDFFNSNIVISLNDPRWSKLLLIW